MNINDHAYKWKKVRKTTKIDTQSCFYISFKKKKFEKKLKKNLQELEKNHQKLKKNHLNTQEED